MALFDIFGTGKKRKQEPPVPKRQAAPRSGVDCYNYRGTVDDYFLEVLTRNFPGYEIRKNISVESLRHTGTARIGTTGKKLVPLSGGTWNCTCGSRNSSNFCPDCGAKRPTNTSVVKDHFPTPVSSYPLITFVLFRENQPKLAIFLCPKRDFDRNKTAIAASELEQACKKLKIPFQRYFREFRNDEAYIQNRVVRDLR